MDSENIPEQFLCPITGTIMIDPVIVEDGHTFQRQAILEWFRRGKKTNPITNLQLKSLQVKPNYALKGIIARYCKQAKLKIQNQVQRNKQLNQLIQKIIASNQMNINKKVPQQKNNEKQKVKKQEKKRFIPVKNTSLWGISNGQDVFNTWYATNHGK